jgi:hypothetical protein
MKYIKSVLWSVAKCLSYIEEARCLKVNVCVNVDLILSTCVEYFSNICHFFFSGVLPEDRSPVSPASH